MKTLIPFNPNGISLDNYLTAAKRKELQDKRYLYVIQSYADTKTGVLKLGEGHGPGRLVEYTHFHGDVDRKFPRLGVKIYYLIATTYKSHVEKTNTKIWKLERSLKRFYSTQIKQVKRGTERLVITPKTLVDKIKELEPNIKDARPHPRYAGPEPESDDDDEPIKSTPTRMITRSQSRLLEQLKKKYSIDKDNIINSKRVRVPSLANIRNVAQTL